MSDRFRGKVVVITGASDGIGRELALQLAAGGARLVLAARRPEELEAVAAACVARGGEARAVPTDVTDPEACRALIEVAEGAFGGIDALVNNAGITTWARVREVTDLSIFERVMRVNYLGAVYCTHFALPALERSRGLLVAISSLTGKTGVPTRAAYAASKHAMQGFFDTLRIELRGTGVDVCVVSPGFVKTVARDLALGPDGAPVGASPRDESRGTMSVEACAARIVRAMAHREREVVMTAKARLGLWLKLVAPGVVDGIAARAVREKGD